MKNQIENEVFKRNFFFGDLVYKNWFAECFIQEQYHLAKFGFLNIICIKKIGRTVKIMLPSKVSRAAFNSCIL